MSDRDRGLFMAVRPLSVGSSVAVTRERIVYRARSGPEVIHRCERIHGEAGDIRTMMMVAVMGWLRDGETLEVRRDLAALSLELRHTCGLRVRERLRVWERKSDWCPRAHALGRPLDRLRSRVECARALRGLVNR